MGAVENVLDAQLPIEAVQILQSLASTSVNIHDSNSMEVIPLKGAMTNEVFEIKWKTEKEQDHRVIVRIYGEGVDVFFDRDDEIQTFEFMSKYGSGPRLLGRFATGRIEEFINARTLSASDLHDPDVSALIAVKMKEFHDLAVPGPKNVTLWDRLRTMSMQVIILLHMIYRIISANGLLIIIQKHLIFWTTISIQVWRSVKDFSVRI